MTLWYVTTFIDMEVESLLTFRMYSALYTLSKSQQQNCLKIPSNCSSMENNLNGKYLKQILIVKIDEVATAEIHEYVLWHYKNRYLLLSQYAFLVSEWSYKSIK